MKIIVKNEKLSSVQEYELVKGKTIELDGIKAERREPVRRWFRVVGHRFVLYRATIICLTPRLISDDSISFSVAGESQITPSGNFMMVKNKKDGDVYILKKGDTISFKTNGLGEDNEYSVSIKEEK